MKILQMNKEILLSLVIILSSIIEIILLIIAKKKDKFYIIYIGTLLLSVLIIGLFIGYFFFK